MATINGIAYSGAYVELSVAGKPVAGATGIDYEESNEHESIRTLGRSEPYAVVDTGVTEYEATIMLLQDEYEALQRSIPAGQSITRIAAFNIVVTKPAVIGGFITDELVDCRFKSVKKGYKAGELSTEMEFPISVRKIRYNI